MIDSTFIEWLDDCLSLEVDDFIEERMRKHIAKHQTPRMIQNDVDPKFSKEIGTFTKTMVKPTL